jgi:hypothetical protein
VNASLSRAVDVVAVTDPGDAHWGAVEARLDSAKCLSVRLNLTDLRASRFVATSDCLRLGIDEADYVVKSNTCVWWRRLGVVDTGDLTEDEAQLAMDEGPHLLIGALDAVGARIVDHPFAVGRAEMKQLQLATARKLGITVPDTVVTNDPDVARAFASGRRTVAKAVSPGIGIAPFVAEILDSDLDAIHSLPTLLQEFVTASADLRVVVVGDRAWAWRRPREAGTVDWRRVDPAGLAFSPSVDEELTVSACQVTEALGLSLSVQDWLETDVGDVFLESNAQGAWLFLAGSEDLVAPAIADHLVANSGQ